MSGIISSPFLLEVLSFVIALTFSVLVQPLLIRISRIYRYEAIPDSRSSHNIPIPTLGGIGIALSMALSSLLFIEIADLMAIAPTISAMFALLVFGVVDDLKKLTAASKFLVQLLVVIPFVLLTDIRIHSLYGLMGFYDLQGIASIVISIFFFVFMINAYNLIDGIDGLAAGLGAIGSSIFGIFFSVQGDYLHAVFAFSLAGALLGFLRFNFSLSKKIFMGDTGSMLLGFILSVFAVKFLAMKEIKLSTNFHIYNSPVVIIGIFIVPIFDTFRVFLVRLMDGRNPFSPDQNHIHHILLRCKLSHFYSSVLLYIVSLIFTCFSILFSDIYFVLYLICLALPLLISIFFFRDPNKPGGILRLLVRVRTIIRKVTKRRFLFFSRKNNPYFSGQYDPA